MSMRSIDVALARNISRLSGSISRLAVHRRGRNVNQSGAQREPAVNHFGERDTARTAA
jgi:hypothetical protein